MSNVAAKKVFIQIETAAEQQEHLKNQRKTLKVLQQGVTTDKENLAGRPLIDKLSRIKAATEVAFAPTDVAKRKKVDTRAAETQTSPAKETDSSTKTITAEDLTSEAKPSELYWEKLAEKRRSALEETLAENHRLHERIDGLEDELNTSRQMLEEARNLVEVLTEMLNDNETERETDADTLVTPGNIDDENSGDTKSSIEPSESTKDVE